MSEVDQAVVAKELKSMMGMYDWGREVPDKVQQLI